MHLAAREWEEWILSVAAGVVGFEPFCLRSSQGNALFCSSVSQFCFLLAASASQYIFGLEKVKVASFPTYRGITEA
jgi:hypothetical protein